MAAGVDQGALGLGIAAPQQEDQAFAFAVQMIDDVIGETFPALALVRAGQAALLRAGANDLVQKPIEERLLITKLMFQMNVARHARKAHTNTV